MHMEYLWCTRVPAGESPIIGFLHLNDHPILYNVKIHFITCSLKLVIIMLTNLLLPIVYSSLFIFLQYLMKNFNIIFRLLYFVLTNVLVFLFFYFLVKCFFSEYQ